MCILRGKLTLLKMAEQLSTEEYNRLKELGGKDIIELRGNPYHAADGKFTTGGAGKTKYAPSPQANISKVKVSPKKFGILRGEFNTKYPQSLKGERGYVSHDGKSYLVESDGMGSIAVLKSRKDK